MTTPIGLYYPYTHFRDDNWLKLAALYWPQLARIAPDGDPAFDSEVTTALKGELDFVLNVAPAKALASAGRIAADALRASGAQIRETYRIEPSASTVRSVGGASNAGGSGRPLSRDRAGPAAYGRAAGGQRYSGRGWVKCQPFAIRASTAATALSSRSSCGPWSLT